MKITGELLKAERIKKDLTIQDISQALKLSPKIIVNIESGDLNNLPAKTFVRGFVKSYAEFLKMDVDQVLKQFHEEVGLTSNAKIKPVIQKSEDQFTEKSNQTKSAPMPSQNDKLSQKNIIYILLALVLVIGITTLNKIMNNYQNEIPENTVSNNLNENNKTSVEVLNTVNTTEITSKTQSVTTSESVSSSTNLATAKEVSSTIPVASDKPSEPHKAEATSSTAQATNSNSNTTINTAESKPLEKSKELPVEVILEAKKDVIVEYAKGNSKDFKLINIKAGMIQIIKSTTGLHLKSNDGNNIQLTVNGIQKGLMSKNNQSVVITY